MYYLDLYCYHCYLVTNTNQNYVLMQKVYKIGKHIYHNNSSKRSAKLIVKFAKSPPPLSLCFVQQITQFLRFNTTISDATKVRLCANTFLLMKGRFGKKNKKKPAYDLLEVHWFVRFKIEKSHITLQHIWMKTIASIYYTCMN